MTRKFKDLDKKVRNRYAIVSISLFIYYIGILALGALIFVVEGVVSDEASLLGFVFILTSVVWYFLLHIKSLKHLILE